MNEQIVAYAYSKILFCRKKEWSMDTCYSTQKIMLSERSQTPKVAQCVIPFIWNIKNKQKHKDRKQIGCCLDRGGNEEQLFNGHEFYFEVIKVFWI